MTVAVEDRTVECAFAKNDVEVPSELTILLDDNIKLANKGGFGMFRIMTRKDGDKRVVWCRNRIEEIKAAKKMFLDLIASGMQPFRVGLNGQASAEVMTEFDPLAEEVIFMPIAAIRGG